MISPEAMISLRDEIVRFCTMISKVRLGCGIFESSFARSKRTYKRNLPIRRRNASRKAARKASVEARRLVPSDCAVWVRSWHTKDGDIMSEMSLFMRVPSVASREADAVGSLKVCRGGTPVGETREEGGSFDSNFVFE